VTRAQELSGGHSGGAGQMVGNLGTTMRGQGLAEDGAIGFGVNRCVPRGSWRPTPRHDKRAAGNRTLECLNG